MCAVTQINEFIKRARYARVNAFITAHLRAQMPMFGRPQAQAKLLKNLETEIQKASCKLHLCSTVWKGHFDLHIVFLKGRLDMRTFIEFNRYIDVCMYTCSCSHTWE